MTAMNSLTTFSCTAGRRDSAIRQFIERNVIERCRECIPGFQSGRLVKSVANPTLTYVLVEWANEAAFNEWQISPVRANLVAGLELEVLDVQLCEPVHEVNFSPR